MDHNPSLSHFKSLYFSVSGKTLDFILIKVEDDRKERMLSIEAEKILSFG